jgi:NitT/TauT family transport system permease protein
MKLTHRRSIERAMPWFLTVIAIILWQAVCSLFNIPKFILPKPTVIAQSLWQWRTLIALNSMQTFHTTMLGFTAAVAGGVLLGSAIGVSKLIYGGVYPILIGFNSVPKVAIVPILVIWFGIGTIPAVITSFMIAFFPIAVNVATGLATLEPELEDVLRSLGASQKDILIKVGIPRSLPYFFASLKIAITMALVGSVISETIAANRGIGYLMVAASARLEVPLVFAGLVVIAAMGMGIYTACALVERHFTRWATRKMDYAIGG